MEVKIEPDYYDATECSHDDKPGTRMLNIKPPFPFGRICYAVLVMRKGGESS